MDFSKYRLRAADLAKRVPAGDHRAFLEKASAPVWNRLEGRPRGDDLGRALQAEVRDALWMLTRQWQLGELEGEDAGTPVFADLRYTCSELLRQGGAPLEARIERQPVFRADGQSWLNLSLRVQMGNYWLKLLSGDAQLRPLKAHFLGKPEYALTLEDAGDAPAEARQYFELYRGKTFDGWKLLVDAARFDAFPAARKNQLGELFVRFERWYERSFLQPKTDAEDRWRPSQLEYADRTTVVGKTGDARFHTEKELQIKEYSGGHLDWYSFEIAGSKKVQAGDPAASRMRSFEYHRSKAGVKRLLPSEVTFDGMPEPRFWAFEDGGTNFASIRAGKNDLAKLALLEFALIYANDWSLLPIEVPAGSHVQIDALTVVDSFGQETAIAPVSQAANGEGWRFFTLDRIGAASGAESALFYPPSLARSLQGKPVEEVYFLRDEVANLVWAIETIVPTPLGRGRSGREPASKDLVASRGEGLVYRKRSHVPSNWIPFVPVVIGDRRVLRRGVLRDEPSGALIRPLTGILRRGLRGDGAWAESYDVDEAEVARDGTVVRKAFQRARWTNGEVYVWLGLHRSVGRGEGSSGLSFDRLEPGSS